MDESTVVRGDAAILLSAYVVLTESCGIPAVFVANNQLVGEGMTEEEAKQVAIRLGLQQGDPGWKHVIYGKT